MTTPLDPTPSQPTQPTSSSDGSPPSFNKQGQIQAKPMTFLGMYFDAEQAQKLWDIIIQTVGQQINKDKEKAIKALKKMRPGHENDQD